MLNKMNFYSFITVVLLNFTLLMPLNAAESKTVVLDVPGMTCKFCPITIRKALEKVPGVIKATADYDSKSATVIFDPAITNANELIKATANSGYPSTVKP